jgi:hypothetical protein
MIVYQKGREHLGDLRIDGDNIKVDLKLVVMLIGLMWLRIRISGGIF